MEDLIPNRKSKTQIDVLWSVQLVVDAVIIGTHKDPSKWSETKSGIGVRERHDAAVHNENGDRCRTVGQKYHTGDESEKIRDMD